MFFSIINKIKINIKFKKNKLRIKLNKKDKHLIKILLKLNFIKYIKHYKNENYDIFLNNNNFLKNIKNLYKPSSKWSISKKELIKLSFKKKWILLLSTNNGIITNFEALKKKTSGILIAILFN